jgi:DNA polymerase delta subunit 2
VSGLDIGSPSPSDAQIQMLVEFLTGEGALDDQALASHISRLIIAGDSISLVASIVEPSSTPDERKSVRNAPPISFELILRDTETICE